MELMSGKMTSKGQITIPKELRELLSVKEGDQFRFLVDEDTIKIEPVKKNLLSHVIGRVVASEPMDLEHMRQVTQKQAAQTIDREELSESE
ncbi:AbrB/MazE/SpoVT family DNA-binding domain-containing protein [Bacillus sp. FJAT-29937]|uniref:AbrB/MazE/SpoVT family DNA-binding domain-containing protein n=1 Tax=Bacillus sp. FJAT-29937 TaxID=1720553 RepID=UPI000834AF61|nr:AbrB/MazE/SpoVT family DNA-binding domain-containing protein [Bacillus sp. FJAT-29937]